MLPAPLRMQYRAWARQGVLGQVWGMLSLSKASLSSCSIISQCVMYVQPAQAVQSRRTRIHRL